MMMVVDGEKLLNELSEFSYEAFARPTAAATRTSKKQ